MEACPLDPATAIRDALKEETGSARFERCFSGQVAFACADSGFQIRVASDFYADWLRRRFAAEIERAACAVLGKKATVSFHVDPTAIEAPTASIIAPACEKPAQSKVGANGSTTVARRGAKSGRRFARFEHFVDGDANRLALAQCRLVAEQPGAISPLLIHGPTGVGKTHLLEATWSAARRARPRARAVYLTAEDFTTQFTQAVCRGGMPAFRGKYRGLQLLVVDDLHFLQGKGKTIVEFVHTIDRIQEHGAQVVTAADRPLAALGELGPELVSRLGGGLDCAVGRPEFSLRRLLVDRFAAKVGLELPGAVAEHVARSIAGDVRLLQGAVHRLQAARQALEQPLTLAVARRVVEDLSAGTSSAVRLADIERAVCDSFGIEPETLHAADKSRHSSQPRMLAMWLARKYTPAALSEIGHYFGRRSHSTVISAEKRLDRLIARHDTIRLADETLAVDAAIRRVEQRLAIG